MLNTAQRIDLMKLSVDLAKAEAAVMQGTDISLAQQATEIFGILRAVWEDGNVLDETNINEVKSVMDVASSIEDLIE
ncbi:MAG: hypothetical protein AAFN80_05970 [Pseudomonadota bacterium]